MRNSFLSKSPGERLKEMRFLLAKFQTRATKLEAPFIILVYGSASYGLKKSKFGNLSDIDLFLVVPKELSVDKILQLAGKIFPAS